MTNLTRWDPFQEAVTLREAVNRLFEESFVPSAPGATGSFVPALDLSETEIGRIDGMRLLLAQVSAVALDAEAHALLHRPDRAENLRRLAGLVRAGRIEVRSAPLAAWAPDFTVFATGAGPFAVVVGPHRFDRGDLSRPTLASVHGREEATRTQRRFDEIWALGYDIRPAVTGILTRAEQDAPGTPPEGETPTGTRISGRRATPEMR